MKFKVAQAKQTVITKWHNFIHIYKLENDFFVKLTKLNYATLHKNYLSL